MINFDFKINSFIRTEGSHCYTAILSIRSSRRLCLTGTPIHNSIQDILSLFTFLEGTGPEKKSKLMCKLEESLNSGNFQPLHLLLRRSTLRRTKELHLPSLPPLTTSIIWIQLPEDTQMLYKTIFLKLSTNSNSKGMFLAQINNLRLCCDHPAMVNNNEFPISPVCTQSNAGPNSDIRSKPLVISISINECYKSPKIKWLLSFLKSRQISDTPTKKTVVYSQWTQFLDMLVYTFHVEVYINLTWLFYRIQIVLSHEGVPHTRLDGSLTQKQQKNSLVFFESDNLCQVLLASIVAAGTGLNIVCADVAVIMVNKIILKFLFSFI